MVQVLAVGEVMLELAPAGAVNGKKLLALGFAGDTYNTAIYLTRLGVNTGYFTRLGDDPYSLEVQALMQIEGLDTTGVEAVVGRTPGLYLIANAAHGERTFSFWRGQSPAREMFANQASIAALEQRLHDVQHVYFSGVTLGILSEEARRSFLRVLRNFRTTGGKVVFDNNYRSQLWRSREEAQLAMADALAAADIALLTDDDDARLWGSGAEADVWQRCLAAGVHEVVLKCGPNPVVVARTPGAGEYEERQRVPVPSVKAVVDTTAAGDSFNAGYLTARLGGAELATAAAFGSRCAGVVIQHRGAIVDREIFRTEVAGWRENPG